jgi:L-cysteine S-thiosulfotransferase
MTSCAVAIAVLLVSFGTSVLSASAQGIPSGDRKSGFDQMGPDTQAMQRDDGRNPAMLAVREGEALWSQAPPNGKPSCAGCHQEAPATMKNVAARYPAFDMASAHPIDLAGRIQQCRTERQASPAWPRESAPLLALTAYVGLQSRGTGVEASSDPRLATFREQGKQLFSQRIGQLNLSCAMCHDDNWGKKLGGSVIPQGHANGYPLFRLEWQGLGSLQRRIRNCLTGVRAEPFAYGDPALINLELYLQERGAGLNVETPAVRP